MHDIRWSNKTACKPGEHVPSRLVPAVLHNYIFNPGLKQFRCEVDLFESKSLDKAFLGALAVERKVAPRGRTTQSCPGFNPQATTSPTSARSNHHNPNAPWCSYHKTSFHTSTECRALKGMHTTNTLFAEATSSPPPEDTEITSLENPMAADPSLILMTSDESTHAPLPLFTYNCQIKHTLSSMILDNGISKNMVSQKLVQRLHLPTTPHPKPYQLGWVQKGGPQLLVSQCCAVTFAIGPFIDTVYVMYHHYIMQTSSWAFLTNKPGTQSIVPNPISII